MEKKKRRNIFLIIIDVIIVLLAVYFIIGYVNFYKISHEKEPFFVVKEDHYEINEQKIDVYDNIIYKIVRDEIPGESLNIRLKLWFMKDVE